MNRIYQMTESETDTTPLASNIIVSDIRSDINRATPICSFNEYGICYKDASLVEPIPIDMGGGTKKKIEHFDLVFYPFKTIYGLNNKTEFKNSFKYTAENLQKIQADLALNKTTAHNITTPTAGEVACIKNYLKLKAKVTTTKKVTFVEESEILNNIYKALYSNFNARHVEFGEEIPYDRLVSTIKNADYRIKDITLDEPDLYTRFCLADRENTELALTENSEQSKRIYNQLALRNVLAGKIAAFDYDTDFLAEYDKVNYPTSINKEGETVVYAPTYPEGSKKITSITSEFKVGTAFNSRKEKDGLVLKENEVIQFRLPNFKTTKTYPAYVNYFIHLNPSTTSGSAAIPATFISLYAYMGEEAKDRWKTFVNSSTTVKNHFETIEIVDQAALTTALKSKMVLFTKTGSTYEVASTEYAEGTQYYYLAINDNIFAALNS
jgi:hypothetical protein